MNYQEARAFLKEKESLGSVYGLETIRILLEKLGNPQNSYKIIHFAGTNGKGSTISFVSTVLKTAGYRVGRYHSPAVFAYEEKIQVQNEWIEKACAAKLLTMIKEKVEEMILEGFAHPTVFEMETAMAFLYFKEKSCDIVCVETGMGGRLDATNVIENPVITAFTSISKDHMGILGNSLKAIAEEKAGIMKKGAIVVTAPQEPEVMEILQNHAQKLGCGLVKADIQKAKIISDDLSGIRFVYPGAGKVHIRLVGAHQVINAILAIEILGIMQKMEYHISKNDIAKGMEESEWKGRFSRILEKPAVFLDGAHNEEAALRLRQAVKFYFTNRKICYIMGILKDKEYEKITKIMAPLADFAVTVTPPGIRGLDGRILAKEMEKYCKNVVFADNLKNAFMLAKEQAGDEGVILGFGSLSFLGELEAVIKKIQENLP